MKIESIRELRVLALNNQEVKDILEDSSIGRRKAVDLIHSTTGDVVSEKLVRTWRDNHKEPEISVFSVPPRMPQPSGPVVAEYAVHIEDPRMYEEAIRSRLDMYTPTTPVGPVTEEHAEAIKKATTLGGSSWGSIPESQAIKNVPRKKHAQTVLGFGDWQIDRHDDAVLQKALQFAEDLQPNKIVLTGDECDNTSIGRHAKGTREEVESNLQDQIDQTVGYLEELRRRCPNAEIIMAHSNHMNRFQQKTNADALGLHSLRALLPENIYQLTELDIQYWRQVAEFLPGFVVAHGHQFNFTSKTHLNQGAQAVKEMGVSLLAGHCHQAAQRTVFQGYEGNGRSLTYVNAGCMMDFFKAVESNGGYISGKSPDWSHGMVVIEHLHNKNFTQLLVAQDKEFFYEGRIY